VGEHHSGPTPQWANDAEVGIDMTVVGRYYYERFAGHVVAVARHPIFGITGKRPEHRSGGLTNPALHGPGEIPQATPGERRTGRTPAA